MGKGPLMEEKRNASLCGEKYLLAYWFFDT